MKNTTKLHVAWLVGVLLTLPSSAQTEEDYRGICHFLPSVEGAKHFAELSPAPSVQVMVDEIARAATGQAAERNRVLVRASTVPNAAAQLRSPDRLVVYNADFFDRLASTSGSDWAESWEIKSVLAHEIGHHILGHTLGVDRRTRLQAEAAADEFSGRVLCKLGGTLAEAKSALGATGSRPHPLYPDLQGRLAAISAGWRGALEDQDCPDVARAYTPIERLVDVRDGVVLTPENASAQLGDGILKAGWIQVDGGMVRSDRPIRIVADVVQFSIGSGFEASEIVIVANEIDGGVLDASGEAGQRGGIIAVGAMRLRGTQFRAQGGNGAPRRSGSDGAPGADGAPGRDGRCGPGVLGQFVGSTHGGDGGNGSAGEDGERGGDGGPGGDVYLVRFDSAALAFDVSGGRGGLGGRGGAGGPGGRGGRGGSGCNGLGGSQPTRDGGRYGLPGASGHDGPPGDDGPNGRLWESRISGLPTLRSLVAEFESTESLVDQLIELAKEN